MANFGGYEYSPFSLKGAKERFQAIGSAFGKIFDGDPETKVTFDRIQNPTLRKVADTVANHPLATAGAAAGAVQLVRSAPAIAAAVRSGTAAVARAAPKVINVAGSAGLRKAVITGGIGYAAIQGANLFRREGAQGLIQGDDPSIEITNPDGSSTKIDDPAGASKDGGSVFFQPSPNGGVIPVYVGGAGQAPTIITTEDGETQIQPQQQPLEIDTGGFLDTIKSQSAKYAVPALIAAGLLIAYNKSR
jgi:hypothetical protein